MQKSGAKAAFGSDSANRTRKSFSQRYIGDGRLVRLLRPWVTGRQGIGIDDRGHAVGTEMAFVRLAAERHQALRRMRSISLTAAPYTSAT